MFALGVNEYPFIQKTFSSQSVAVKFEILVSVGQPQTCLTSTKPLVSTGPPSQFRPLAVVLVSSQYSLPQPLQPLQGGPSAVPQSEPGGPLVCIQYGSPPHSKA